MTARTDLVEVICDGPDEQTECPDSAAMADYGTAARIRSVLKTGDDAWRTALPGGIDRCAKCTAAAQATGVSGSSPGEAP